MEVRIVKSERKKVFSYPYYGQFINPKCGDNVIVLFYERGLGTCIKAMDKCEDCAKVGQYTTWDEDSFTPITDRIIIDP